MKGINLPRFVEEIKAQMGQMACQRSHNESEEGPSLSSRSSASGMNVLSFKALYLWKPHDWLLLVRLINFPGISMKKIYML